GFRHPRVRDFGGVERRLAHVAFDAKNREGTPIELVPKQPEGRHMFARRDIERERIIALDPSLSKDFGMFTWIPQTDLGILPPTEVIVSDLPDLAVLLGVDRRGNRDAPVRQNDNTTLVETKQRDQEGRNTQTKDFCAARHGNPREV